MAMVMGISLIHAPMGASWCTRARMHWRLRPPRLRKCTCVRATGVQEVRAPARHTRQAAPHATAPPPPPALCRTAHLLHVDAPRLAPPLNHPVQLLRWAAVVVCGNLAPWLLAPCMLLLVLVVLVVLVLVLVLLRLLHLLLGDVVAVLPVLCTPPAWLLRAPPCRARAPLLHPLQLPLRRLELGGLLSPAAAG